jgi:hypothetical protein
VTAPPCHEKDVGVMIDAIAVQLVTDGLLTLGVITHPAH